MMTIKKVICESQEAIYIEYSKDLEGVLRDIYKDSYDLESLVVVSLNSLNKVLDISTVALGSSNMCNISLRDVFYPVIRSQASKMIISHNHPSGNTKVSEHDMDFTRDVLKASQLLGISLLDHIIIGDDFYSFLNNDLMEKLALEVLDELDTEIKRRKRKEKRQQAKKQ